MQLIEFMEYDRFTLFDIVTCSVEKIFAGNSALIYFRCTMHFKLVVKYLPPSLLRLLIASTVPSNLELFTNNQLVAI